MPSWHLTTLRAWQVESLLQRTLRCICNFFFDHICPRNMFFSCSLLCCCSVTQSCPTVRPCGLQHARLPCPSPSPRIFSDSCPSSWWCHPTISSSVIPLSSGLQSFPALVFSKESALHIRWPKHWSFNFSISPFNEYSGLISFRIDWFDLLAVQGIHKSLL